MGEEIYNSHASLSQPQEGLQHCHTVCSTAAFVSLRTIPSPLSENSAIALPRMHQDSESASKTICCESIELFKKGIRREEDSMSISNPDRAEDCYDKAQREELPSYLPMVQR